MSSLIQLPSRPGAGAAQAAIVAYAQKSTRLQPIDDDTYGALSRHFSPQQVIAPGAHVDLVYQANFNNSILAIPAGELTRLEVIVSFGNAGARGGSGAVAP